MFPSGTAFLEVAPVWRPALVLDIQSPRPGVTIPRELKARRLGLPVIVLGRSGAM